MNNVAPHSASALVALALLSTTQLAVAQGAAPTVTRQEVTTTGPNRALLHSGLWIFGLAYIPAVVVGIGSDRHGDKNLLIPVVGPWLDLAARSDCPVDAGCSNESVNKALLIVDGVFQGLGALDFVGAFLFPETRTVTVGRTKPPYLRVVPAQWGTSTYGISAWGQF